MFHISSDYAFIGKQETGVGKESGKEWKNVTFTDDEGSSLTVSCVGYDFTDIPRRTPLKVDLAVEVSRFGVRLVAVPSIKPIGKPREVSRAES